jgi:hypothetical protein
VGIYTHAFQVVEGAGAGAARKLVGLATRSAVKRLRTREGSPLSTNEDETDPSTPTARRSNRPAATEGTDPGVGEPVTEPVAVPTRPLGIVVPGPGISTMTPTPPPTLAQQALLKNKDSVEILLDGMTDQRLDRTRTTPQSDGQASAAYHSEHEPRVAEKAPLNNVPKVLLDRPLTPTSVSARLSPAPARAYSADATVFVPPQRLGLRVALAALLGLVVAGLVFGLLEVLARRDAPPQAGAVEGTRPSAVTSAGRIAVPQPASSAVAAPPPAAPASAAESAMPAATEARVHPGAPSALPTAPPAAKRKTKAAPSSSVDVGEFRTNF